MLGLCEVPRDRHPLAADPGQEAVGSSEVAAVLVVGDFVHAPYSSPNVMAASRARRRRGTQLRRGSRVRPCRHAVQPPRCNPRDRRACSRQSLRRCTRATDWRAKGAPPRFKPDGACLPAFAKRRPLVRDSRRARGAPDRAERHKVVGRGSGRTPTVSLPRAAVREARALRLESADSIGITTGSIRLWARVRVAVGVGAVEDAVAFLADVPGRKLHEPFGKQHAPIGCGQGLRAVGQIALPVSAGDLHGSRMRIAQSPLSKQQAPNGCGHGFGKQCHAVKPRVQVPPRRRAGAPRANRTRRREQQAPEASGRDWVCGDERALVGVTV